MVSFSMGWRVRVDMDPDTDTEGISDTVRNRKEI